MKSVEPLVPNISKYQTYLTHNRHFGHYLLTYLYKEEQVEAGACEGWYKVRVLRQDPASRMLRSLVTIATTRWL